MRIFPLRSARHAGAVVVALLCGGEGFAAPSSEALFPSTTVGWVSIGSAPDFSKKWDRTQIGQLAQDEAFRPFAEHAGRAAVKQLGDVKQSFGLDLADLFAATSGEMALGMIYQEEASNSKKDARAAMAVTLETSSKRDEVDSLLSKLDKELTARGAKRSTQSLGGTTLVLYSLPPSEKRNKPVQIAYFESEDLLCLVDDRTQAESFLARLSRPGAKTLATLPEHQEIMRRVAASKGPPADVRWFISPFKYDLASRSREASRDRSLPDKKRTFTILREQGFDAILGVGGLISVAIDPQQDFIHRTLVYAPPKPGTEGRPAAEKYDRAMRMAELPNRSDMEIEPWAPRMTASYATHSLDIQNAFEHVESIVDAMAGYDKAFETTLEGFEKDPFGPKIKVRDEIIKYLGNRVTVMTDYTMPITEDCERYLFVIEVTNAAALKTPIDKLMENDGAVPNEVGGMAYWELMPDETALTDADLGGDLLTIDNEPSDAIEGDPLLRRAAVCLHENHLIIASDVEFLEQALFGVEEIESLAQRHDYRIARRSLDAFAPPGRCSWTFRQTDECVRPTYELIRQGKMPEGQTFFARLLNEVLTTERDEELGIIRKQRIEGDRLPSFELARRYFGPAARAVHAEEDGWFITGVILNKEGQ